MWVSHMSMHEHGFIIIGQEKHNDIGGSNRRDFPLRNISAKTGSS